MRVERLSERAGLGEAVGVAVGNGVIVGVGFGVGQIPSAIVMVSIRQPGAATALSVINRNLNVTVWPARLGPRFITVSMEPLELPVQAILPARGVPSHMVEISVV